MTKIVLAALIIGAIFLLFRKPAKAAPRMPEVEARETLGVSATAGEEEIRAAHRRLVAALHPDKGGSPELTRRINAARDTLLRRR